MASGMPYRTVTTDRPAPGGTSFEGEISHAMFALNEDGYEVVSIIPIVDGGNTSKVIVVGKKFEAK